MSDTNLSFVNAGGMLYNPLKKTFSKLGQLFKSGWIMFLNTGSFVIIFMINKKAAHFWMTCKGDVGRHKQ